MKKYIKIYKEAIKISFSAAIAYRVNFLLNMLITLISNIVLPMITIMIYGAGASFNNWSMYEVLLIQSIFTISNGFSSVFFNGIVWKTMDEVREGTLEITLIKPVNCMLYLMASTFSIDGIGVILGGTVFFYISIAHIGQITALMWLEFLIFFIMGLFVMVGMELLMAATSFKWVANSRIPEMYNSFIRFGYYPQNIFNRSIILITSYIMPVAMIGFYPASALLGLTEKRMFFSIIPCILFMLIGMYIYQYMVRQYEGVGG